jgi:flagellin-like hook-associated protein FlgL
MTNDVVLSAALRSNLLSLQNTQSQISTHQGRLSTGKKVNSALDNPQSFFAAQALSNRASDLSNLLDSIGQSIQVINAANNGVTALTTLINQASSIASQAQDALSGASTTAKVTGNVALAANTDLTSLAGLTTGAAAGAGDRITFQITDPTSQEADGSVNYALTTGGANTAASQQNTAVDPSTGNPGANFITIATGDTSADLVNKINDLNNGFTSPVIKASLDSSGHLSIEAVNGGTLQATFLSGNATPADAANLGFAAALGFGGTAKLDKQGTGTDDGATNFVEFTQTAGNSLGSGKLYYNNGTSDVTALASTKLQDLLSSNGTALTSFTDQKDSLKLTVGGKQSGELLDTSAGGLASQTIQSLVDNINQDATIGGLVSASFDATAGKIVLTPKNATATDVQFDFSTIAAGGATDTLNLGFGTNALLPGAASSFATEDIRFGAAAGNLANLQNQYNTTLSQVDALVKDTGYAGTNLLNGNDLTTFFNETRTSSLTTAGVDFTAKGLGLNAANFQSSSAVTSALDEANNALSTVRNFGSSLAGNLTIIQARQTFTTSLINTLQTGSDNLTNADQNQEGADLLALQTRQSLGITALSLASQSQQAVLRLFG